MINKWRFAFLAEVMLMIVAMGGLIVGKTEPRQNRSDQPAGEKTAWVLPPCPTVNSNVFWIGVGIKFPLLKGAKVKKIVDIDYQEYLVRVSKDARPLELWWGALVTAPLTKQQLMQASTTSQERTIEDPAKRERGIDSRGQESDAKFWRIFDVPGVGLAKYTEVSAQARRDYDLIIDSACFERP